MGRPTKDSLPKDLSQLLHQIGSNISAIREDRELSQAALARHAHVSITTVNEIETRKSRDIQLSTLTSIARVLNVEVAQLLQGSDVELNSRDQEQLLKASDALLRITRKLR
jgi:transcriptional regulator with XRE-family HTH domain